jgi:hypothetical protein
VRKIEVRVNGAEGNRRRMRQCIRVHNDWLEAH